MSTHRPKFHHRWQRKYRSGAKNPDGEKSLRAQQAEARRSANGDAPMNTKKSTSRLKGLVLVIVVISVIDYLNSGSITWPGKLFDSAVDQVAGPDSGLRGAKDAVESLGRAKEGDPVPTFDIEGRVVRVADGDTVSILDANNKQHKIRMYGIDTPERDQPFGRKARQVLADMIADERVGVVIVETDDYGRIVGTVYHDDTHINAAMVRSGYAWWYRHYAPHSRLLSEAETAAREASLGLWADRDPVPPWDWRRNQRKNGR